MAEEKVYEKKLALLVEKAGELREEDFQAAIDELIQQVESADEDVEIEILLAPYLQNTSLPIDVRVNVIRAAGHLVHDIFLIPLKNIIDHEDNIRLKQESIQAVGKYNNRPALNILKTSLKNLSSNAILLRAINGEIQKIKKNNPLLGLLPRFLEGEKNSKVFRVTLDLLKRILTPEDASIFAKYLDAEDRLIQKGSFEILCTSGDIFHDNIILDYFYNYFDRIEGIEKKENNDLYWLIYHFQQYLVRYQFLIEEQVPTMIKQFEKIGDIRAHTLYNSIICRSQKPASITFMAETFLEHPELRKNIIQSFSGNNEAVDFLFEKYGEDDPALLESAVKSLLNTIRGLDFFMKNFFTLSFDTQELVTLNLPYSRGHDLVEFIRKIFEADVFRLKEICLLKVKETFEFSVKDLLFDPNHEREFMFMGDEYLDTITRLFPVTSVKYVFSKISSGRLSVSKTKKFLDKIETMIGMDLVFQLRGKKFISDLFNRIVMSNNKELMLQFMGILKHIKTLDIETYRAITEAMNIFITKREKNITPEETGELNRVKRSLRDLFYEFKRTEDGNNEIKKFFEKKETDFLLLNKIVKDYQLSLVLNLETFSKNLSERFKESNIDEMPEWTDFFKGYPALAELCIQAIRERTQGDNSALTIRIRDLADELMGEPVRLLLNFKNRAFTAILREQFQETVPHIHFYVDEEEPWEEDVLLCDVEALSDLVLQGKQVPKKVYLFMEQAEGFSAFRSLKPQTFVAPFSYYRITREVLYQLYT